MIEEERYFTIKEAAKLLGVPKRSVKRRIESKNLGAYKRLSKRGFELVIPQGELTLEIMSSLPDSRQLSLYEFETLVIKRLEAIAAGRDRRVSRTLKLLYEEFVQLKAEIENLDVSTTENQSPTAPLDRNQLSTRHETELVRSPQ